VRIFSQEKNREQLDPIFFPPKNEKSSENSPQTLDSQPKCKEHAKKIKLIPLKKRKDFFSFA
jgi:hypothetical protein